MNKREKQKQRKGRIKTFAKHLAEPLFWPENVDLKTLDVLLGGSARIAAMMLKDGEEEDEVRAAAALVNDACQTNNFEDIYTPQELASFGEALRQRKLDEIMKDIDPLKMFDKPMSEFEGDEDDELPNM